MDFQEVTVNIESRSILEFHTQHPKKLNSWAGIFGNNIIGTFFLPRNLIKDMLKNASEPRFIEIVENDANWIMFQQDGIPLYHVFRMRQCLDVTFPGWIGRSVTIEW